MSDGTRETIARGSPQPGRSEFSLPRLPSVTTPKGGGAIRGIGEKFSMNLATGTGSVSVPIATTPGRAGFELGLTLRYDSGAGNGPFGLGWSLSTPSITRKTDKGLPRYDDDDVFLLSGAEDLVRIATTTAGDLDIARYRPRTEGLFARIERICDRRTGDIHWRVTTRDNVTNVYGLAAHARIADPGDPGRVFSWLLESTLDDRGNIARYTYDTENGSNVGRTLSEDSRFADAAFTATAQRYLKRIEYGNSTPNIAGDWCFEVVFEYGEHAAPEPITRDRDATSRWTVREDPFSTYRAGFELRTYRLCRRVLMFHRFAELHREPTLVRATSFAYRSSPNLTYLIAITQTGYTRDGDSYRWADLPPLELEYVEPALSDEARELRIGADAGFDMSQALWHDLDGEGLPGLLLTTPGGWFYRRNLGDGELADLVPLRRMAAPSPLGRHLQLADLDDDGRSELVGYDPPLAGYFARDDGGFSRFHSFRSVPQVDWSAANHRLVDLDGDGHADLLVTENEVHVWYPSLATDGFGPARSFTAFDDEDLGPQILLHDGGESVQLVDMSGDGLSDIVRIRSGEVCYWPNLGYGRFGRKITMANSPDLTDRDRFDPRRVRFGDLDGSGTHDLIYLGGEGAVVYFNQAGNAFSSGVPLRSLPTWVRPEEISTADLLGLGMTGLVWSSPLPGAGASIRYVDPMGGVKPHLLRAISNNLGGRTTVRYRSSTTFHAEDRRRGQAWCTRLPFAVHVVDRVVHEDLIAGSTLVTNYEYHHGHFDLAEREFGGFARVDQVDAESFDDERDPAQMIHTPSKRVVTWFHTGASLDGDAIESALAREYAPRDDVGDLDRRVPLLPDTPMLPQWSAREQREATRALRGKILRQETFREDDLRHPYLVSERCYRVDLLHTAGAGPHEHGVFLAVGDQSFEAHYERQASDARIQHNLVLETDAFGNVLRSIDVGYGRDAGATAPVAGLPAELITAVTAAQTTTLIAETVSRFTVAIDDASGHRAPLPCETIKFELVGIASSASVFTPSDFRDTQAYRRKTEHRRTVFRSDDLRGPLPLRITGARALACEEFQLALTRDIIANAFVRTTASGSSESLLTASSSELTAGGYVSRATLVAGGLFPDDTDAETEHTERDDDWWAPSGRSYLSPGADPMEPDPPDVELAFAEHHFFLPHRFRDPFGAWAHLRYDDHDLLPVDVRDALDNRTIAGERSRTGAVKYRVSYRVLQPEVVCDPNRNRVEFAFDALGMCVGTATKGKLDGPREGDDLAGFAADLGEAQLLAYLADPLAHGHELLAGATTRFIYDVHAFYRTRACAMPQPPLVTTLHRETHVAAVAPGTRSNVQVVFAYFDGSGREIQKKIPAEHGQWVGTGWVVFDNRGKPVRKYEPYFTTTHHFEGERKQGISATICYDAFGRAVATFLPAHTYEKVTVTPWSETSWDANDTTLLDPTKDGDVADYLARFPTTELLPTWFERCSVGAREDADAAAKTALHASTPTVVYLDPLGRKVLTIATNRFVRDGSTIEEFVGSLVELDIDGLVRAHRDALDREAERNDYDLRGRRIRTAAMDSGTRWMLADATDRPSFAWDSRGHAFVIEYDALRRPLRTRLAGQQHDPSEIVAAETVYGESLALAEELNLRGRVLAVRDGAGEVSYLGRTRSSAADEAYDFKGNAIVVTRRLATEYRHLPDWRHPSLEPEPFVTETRVDALNRPIRIVAPDGSTTLPVFNEANLLERVEFDRAGARSTLVANVDYNARGQRTFIEYGNGAWTTYAYDDLTFHLRTMRTRRPSGAWPGDDNDDDRPSGLQYLSYTHDPVGNITAIRDDAQETIYFAGAVVRADASYTYDALYQLRRATGREHVGQAGRPQTTWNDEGRRQLVPHPHDGAAMRAYVEDYDYDLTGNLRTLAHNRGLNAGTWTRTIDHASSSNAVTATSLEGGAEGRYAHDEHGNLRAMPHLSGLSWDAFDRLASSSRQVVTNGGTPETTYYVYDAQGKRARKVTEAYAAPGTPPARRNECIYLDHWETYREFAGVAIALQRETLHVYDDTRRVVAIETRSIGDDGSPAVLARYQIGDHHGTVAVELDDTADTITYEEYYPYGATSFHSVRSARETPKRFRYSGQERDDETGLSYHDARYYVPWLGSWTSPDPSGIADGLNRYAYAHNSPIRSRDPSGRAADPSNSLGRKTELKVQDFLDTARESFPTEQDAGGLAAEPGRVAPAFEGTLDRTRSKGAAVPDHRDPNRNIALETKGRRAENWMLGDLPDAGRIAADARKHVKRAVERVLQLGTRRETILVVTVQEKGARAVAKMRLVADAFADAIAAAIRELPAEQQKLVRGTATTWNDLRRAMTNSRAGHMARSGQRGFLLLPTAAELAATGQKIAGFAGTAGAVLGHAVGIIGAMNQAERTKSYWVNRGNAPMGIVAGAFAGTLAWYATPLDDALAAEYMAVGAMDMVASPYEQFGSGRVQELAGMVFRQFEHE